jgi:hypothetical protein
MIGIFQMPFSKITSSNNTFGIFKHASRNFFESQEIPCLFSEPLNEYSVFLEDSLRIIAETCHTTSGFETMKKTTFSLQEMKEYP